MFFDLILGFIFLISVFTLWYRVSLCIPELVAIPDSVINEHLQKNSAKFRLLLLHFRTHLKEGNHKLFFWKVIGKTLYRIHLFILRIDNRVDTVLRRVRAKGININGVKNGDAKNKETDYWRKFQS